MLENVFQSTLAMFLSPASHFFWGYLLVALFAATAVAMRGETLVGALRKVFDPELYLHRSAVADYALTLLNNALAAASGGFGLIGSFAIAQAGASGLAHLFGPSPHWTAGAGAIAAFTLANTLAVDYGNYSRHLLQHRIPALWELHKVHHTAEVLTPITTSRGHPIILILTMQYLAFFSGLVSAVFFYLYGGPVAGWEILGVSGVTLLFWTLLGGHLAHMNCWLVFPRPLNWLLYSPALHQIHHSRDPRHFDTNMGLIFSFWDRLHGTLYEPTEADRVGLAFGLDEAEDLRTVPQLLWTPIRKIAAMAARSLRPQVGGIAAPGE